MTLKEIIPYMRQWWPFDPGRRAVLAGYTALRAYPHMLADIALRNHVFADAPAGDAIALAIAEGRRRCANEIFMLARVDHDQLWQALEKKPQPGDRP